MSVENLLKVKVLNCIEQEPKPILLKEFNKAFKDMIFKRVEEHDNKGKRHIQWIDYVSDVPLTYNYKTRHSATGLTPIEARKGKNEFKAMLNVASKARKDRVYPEVSVGDTVKIIRNKRTGEKEIISKYLAGEYTVANVDENLGQKYYMMIGFNRPLLRHNILKV